MNTLQKVALSLLVIPNAYITFLWFLGDLNGMNTIVDAFVALFAGIAIDIVCITILSTPGSTWYKYVLALFVGIGSATIAYYRYNGTFMSFDGGHMLHTIYPVLTFLFMSFLTHNLESSFREQKRLEEIERTKAESIERQRIAKMEEQERADKEHAANMRAQGKEQCPYCNEWFKKGGSISTHKKMCAYAPHNRR